MTLTVCVGGNVLVSNDASGVSQYSTAIAFDQGKVVALGADAELLTATANEVTNLAGGTIAAAPGDGHAHPVLGALESAGPNVRGASDLQGILDAVAAWKAENPEAEWIVGASYDATFAPGGLFDARWLDEVTGDTPTILRAWDYHTAWVNTAALEAGGIDADTPDPDLGRIMRREDGTPLGTLQEAAANNFLADVAPSFTLEQRVAAIEHATREYAALGMTWVQDAWVEPDDVAHYLVAAAQDRLHTRVNLAQRADPAIWRDQLDAFAAIREQIRAASEAHYGPSEAGFSRLSAETVKFFVDGVIENHTAALGTAYADRRDDAGLQNWKHAELNEAAAAFAELGFQLHFHAIGDAANTVALNALQAIRTAQPSNKTQHVIAHVAMLAPGEAERFAQIGVIANFEPFWAQCDTVMRDLTIPHIGPDREGWQYLIGSVLRSGATVSFGSDWPVTTKDWRPGLSTAVTRHSHLEPDSAAWLPAERISAAQAYGAYTRGIAAQAQASDRGTLEVGMTADAVWLSANPLEVTPIDIPSITVLGTWLAGSRSY